MYIYMGGKHSTVKKTQIENVLDTQIKVRQTNKNKFVNNVVTKNITSLTQNNSVRTAFNCNASNFVSFSQCDIGANAHIDISQQATAKCQALVISHLENDTDLQNEFLNTLKASLTSQTQASQDIINNQKAQDFFKDIQSTNAMSDILDNISKTVGNAFDDVTGTSTDQEDITSVTNKINTHFDTMQYNENEVDNIIDNLNQSAISNSNTFTCDLSNTASNDLDLTGCKIGDNFWLSDATKSLVNSISTCTSDQTNIDQMITQMGTDAQDMGESTASDDASSRQSQDNRTETDNEKSVSLFGLHFDTGKLAKMGAAAMIGLLFLFIVIKVFKSLRHKSDQPSYPYPYPPPMMPPPMGPPPMMPPPMGPPPMGPPPMGPPPMGPPSNLQSTPNLTETPK